MSNELDKKEKAIVKKDDRPLSVRFTEMVEKEFASKIEAPNLTNFQKRLIQNYCIAIDTTLKNSEAKRLATNKNNDDNNKSRYNNNLAYSWNNIDRTALAPAVIASAKLGLDPALKNHINFIPYKDTDKNLYGIGFMPGYVGLEIKARKYGLNPPDTIIFELIYSTDFFQPIKKSPENNIESYKFEIKNPFDRGDFLGGFYYSVYSKNPEKNQIVIMSKKDIDKRKPKYASAEFWGGVKDEWKNGKKTGNEIEVEGWYEEMALKTMKRAAWDKIPIDSQKIDNDFMQLKTVEDNFRETQINNEIKANANTQIFDGDFEEVEETTPEPQAETKEKKEPKKTVKKEAETPAEKAGELFNEQKPSFAD